MSGDTSNGAASGPGARKATDPQARRWVRYGPVALLVLAGVGLSLAAFVVEKDREDAKTRERFVTAAAERASALRRTIERGLNEIEMLGAYYLSSVEVTRDEFHQFVTAQLAHNRAVRALAWVPRVPRAQRAEQAARLAGFPQFRITQRGAHGAAVAADRDEYFPVCFMEPYRGNEAALGFDLCSEPTRRQALEQSGRTGAMRATGRITLAQETGRQQGVLVFLPVYRKNRRQAASRAFWSSCRSTARTPCSTPRRRAGGIWRAL